MNNSIRMFAAVSVAAVSFAQLGIANAAGIKVVSAAGFQTVMADLGPKYERASGHKLAVSFANLEPSLKRLQDGEAADLAISEGGDRRFGEGREGRCR